MKMIALSLTVIMLIGVLSLGTVNVSASRYSKFTDTTISTSTDSKINIMLNLIDKQSFSNPTLTVVKDRINALLFNAQYSPFKSNNWPAPNSGNTVGSITDNGINNGNAITFTPTSKGCMAYSDFASKYVYGTERSARKSQGEAAGKMTAAELKVFIQKEAQAGEHIRVDNAHSLTFVSADDTGFYILHYPEYLDNYIHLEYAKYETFANECNSRGKQIWLYNNNTATNNTTIPTPEPNPGCELYQSISSTGTNIRSAPGTANALLGNIPNGAYFDVSEKASADGWEWGKVTYNGITGWASLHTSTSKYIGGTISLATATNIKANNHASTNGTTAAFNLDSGRNLTLTWDSVPNATKYLIEPIYWNGSNWIVSSDIVREVTTLSTTYNIFTDLRWGFRITAGNSSGWSNNIAWWFAVDIVTVPPTNNMVVTPNVWGPKVKVTTDGEAISYTLYKNGEIIEQGVSVSQENDWDFSNGTLSPGTYIFVTQTTRGGVNGPFRECVFTIPSPLLFGDVSGTGEIDSTDARMLLQHEVNLITLTNKQLTCADVSNDGETDSTDARLILQYEVQLIRQFPANNT